MSVAEYESQVAKVAVEKLYRDEKTADVHFVFQSGERVPAHKYLLAAASDVFDAMFYGSIKEKGDVKIEDASAAGFVEFLQFFYSSKIKLTMANIGDVMDFGHKYDVAECVNLCIRFLMEHLSVDSVLQAHGLAVLFEHDDLEAKCKHVINLDTKGILQSFSFLECDQQALNYILGLDELSCSEKMVFEAVMSWVKAASKQEELTKDIIQTHLGDLFYQIRFRSMTHDEFVDLLPSFGKLFTADEFNEILQMIKNDDFKPKMFSALLRNPFNFSWDENANLQCNRYNEMLFNEPYRIQNTETTTFTTNTKLLLGYFICAPIFKYVVGNCIKMEKPVPADVTIYRVPNEIETLGGSSEFVVLPAWKIELTHELTSKKLPNPIVIDPKFKYKIRMNIGIPEDCAAYRILKSEMQLQNNIIVKFHDDPLVNGKIRGLVYCLEFNQIK